MAVNPQQRNVVEDLFRAMQAGVGSGLNLPFYTENAKRVVGLDPSPKLLSMAQKATRTIACPIELLEGTAEAIALDSNSMDTVVTTWTLCSIPDIARALAEVRRGLRPEGRLLFVEHGRSPDDNVRRWQDRLTPVWKRVGGACHLNRPISHLIEDSGFRVEQIDQGYMPGPRPMTFMYEGSARRSPLRRTSSHDRHRFLKSRPSTFEQKSTATTIQDPRRRPRARLRSNLEIPYTVRPRTPACMVRVKSGAESVARRRRCARLGEVALRRSGCCPAYCQPAVHAAFAGSPA
jgi:SAM-dependent methyltransferase